MSVNTFIFQCTMSLFLLPIHDQEIGQKQLDRRRHLQTHCRKEHPAQSDIHIRRQGMDCSTGLLNKIYIHNVYINAS